MLAAYGRTDLRSPPTSLLLDSPTAKNGAALRTDDRPPHPSSAHHDRSSRQRQVPFQTPRCEFHRTFTTASNTSNLVRLLFSFLQVSARCALRFFYPLTTIHNPL